MPEEYKPLNQDTDPNYNVKGGVVVVPGSPLAKEMERWEQFPSRWGSNPGNPYVMREFPMMLYKAQKINGKPFVVHPEVFAHDYPHRDAYKQAQQKKDHFDRENQRVVRDETEMSRAVEDGWRPTPQEAIALVLSRDETASRATAEREYRDQFMSEVAQREIRAAKDAVGNEHLPEIPEKPIRRRGRPKGSKNKPKE